MAPPSPKTQSQLLYEWLAQHELHILGVILVVAAVVTVYGFLVDEDKGFQALKAAEKQAAAEQAIRAQAEIIDQLLHLFVQKMQQAGQPGIQAVPAIVDEAQRLRAEYWNYPLPTVNNPITQGWSHPVSAYSHEDGASKGSTWSTATIAPSGAWLIVGYQTRWVFARNSDHEISVPVIAEGEMGTGVSSETLAWALEQALQGLMTKHLPTAMDEFQRIRNS